MINFNLYITEVSDLTRAGWIIVQGECNQACLNCWAAADDVNKSPMEHIAQGKRSDTLGFPHSRVSAPCKGRSFNPLCCYSCLIADLAVLKWNIVCIFCSIPAPCLKAFALTGRDCSNTRYPGCRFACPGLCAPLGFQPALAKSETWVMYVNKYVKLYVMYVLALSDYK